MSRQQGAALSSVVLGQQQFTLWPKPREGTKKPECLSVPGLSPPAEPEPEAMRPVTFITTSHCQQEERTQKNGAVYCRFLILFRKQLFRTISVTACALDGSHEDKDKKGRRRKREGSKKGKILYRWRVSTTGNTEGSEKSNTEREEKGDAKAKGRGIKKMEDKGSRHNTSCSLFVSASSLLNHNTSWQVHVFSTKIILGARQPNPLSHPSLYS